MEYSFPDKFGTIEVAGFFNLTRLLAQTLENGDFYGEQQKLRALFWAARMSALGVHQTTA